jgi:type II secretory pathway component PulK
VSPSPAPGEQGYALIAAVAAIAVFAGLALAIATATRISLAGGDGELARARADAAADAGVAIAVQGLVGGDEATLALIGGRQRRIDFAGAQLTIRVADERGKIALNHIEDDTVAQLLEQAGLSGDELAVARDSLLDWIDYDDLPRANGAETDYYAPLGIAPRNGALTSVDELARIRGFTPRLVNQLRPYVTVDNDALPFDPSHAQPQALAVMSQAGGNWAEVIERQREADGEQTAFAATQPAAIQGHPLTIAVDADVAGGTGSGGHAHHEVIVEVTGNPAQPYIIHAAR